MTRYPSALRAKPGLCALGLCSKPTISSAFDENWDERHVTAVDSPKSLHLAALHTGRRTGRQAQMMRDADLDIGPYDGAHRTPCHGLALQQRHYLVGMGFE